MIKQKVGLHGGRLLRRRVGGEHGGRPRRPGLGGVRGGGRNRQGVRHRGALARLGRGAANRRRQRLHARVSLRAADRDSRINRIFEGTNEILRLFIALTAMNDVGTQLKELASAVRNSVADPIKGFGVLSGYARKRASHRHRPRRGEARLHAAAPRGEGGRRPSFERAPATSAASADRVLRKHGRQNRRQAVRHQAHRRHPHRPVRPLLRAVPGELRGGGEGREGASRELGILGVFSGRARRRMRSNLNRMDDNDDDLVKALADHAFENEGYSWDTL